MADTIIKFKRGSTAGVVPTGLTYGEPAVNVTDRILYIGGTTGETISLSFVGATGATGSNGTNGATGSQGATGATGSQGIQGPTGATGVGFSFTGNTYNIPFIYSGGLSANSQFFRYPSGGVAAESFTVSGIYTGNISPIQMFVGTNEQDQFWVLHDVTDFGAISAINLLGPNNLGMTCTTLSLASNEIRLMPNGLYDPVRTSNITVMNNTIGFTAPNDSYVRAKSPRIILGDNEAEWENYYIEVNNDDPGIYINGVINHTGGAFNSLGVGANTIVANEYYQFPNGQTAASIVKTINGSSGAINFVQGSNITITQSGNTFTFASSGGGGGSGFTYTASAPGSPAIGDRWIDSDTGKEYVYINDGTSSQWIEPVSSNGLAGLTYTPSSSMYEFGGTGSFVKLGVGTTLPANTLDVVGLVSATSTTNTIDIIASTDGAGLRIAQATSGGSSRIGAIRLGRGTNSLSNTYLENSVGTFTIYNGVGNTGTNMFQLSTAGAVFGVPISGGITCGVVASDGGYRITSNAINALTGTTYSLLAADNGKVITWNNNTSGVTLTVPSGLPVGFNTTIIQIGTGSVGITGSGVTLNSFEGKLRIAGQHAAVSIISYSSNVFNVAGGLTG